MFGLALSIYALLIWFNSMNIFRSSANNSVRQFNTSTISLMNQLKILYNHVDKVETYTKVTPDGYIVNAFRLPRKNRKAVIYLAHPLTADASVWFSFGNKSLAFILWNAGYEIWMPSNRGTLLSPGHMTMQSSEFKYSNFSFHEIATIDQRLWIKFIAETTGRNDIVYIGHSMSSTTALVYASLFPKEAKKYVKVFIVNSPTYRFQYMTNSLFYMGKTLAPIIWNVTNSFGIGGLYYNAPFMLFIRPFLKVYPVNQLAALVLSLFAGWTPDNFDPEIIAYYATEMPRGVPIKALYHFSQQFASGRFQFFDYEERNREVYGQDKPPLYPIKDIQTPIHIIYGDKDDITTGKDCELLYDELPPAAKVYGKHKLSGYNHIDLHASKHRIEEVFDYLLKFIDKLFQ